jgi:nucleoside-diphosphate-sugar epimerase
VEASLNSIIGVDEPILITGSTGFLGTRVVAKLLEHGFRNIRCFARASSDVRKLEEHGSLEGGSRIEILRGNLLSASDCDKAVRDATVVYHLAAGMTEKSFPGAFMNSVVTTRNLLEACLRYGRLKRFVNISSFAVYTNRDKPRRSMLDESCPIESEPAARGEAYCYAKVKQDELVAEYGRKYALPYVIVRPGAVYGPGRTEITGRVGSGAFGIFLHLGGSNVIPLTYVDNCADAVVLAGTRPGIEGEVVNVVDDDLPTSRRFLRLYKQRVGSFTSVPVPRLVSYLLCALWEGYSKWSEGQLPLVFNRPAWHAYWKGSGYANGKAKRLLGWAPKVTTDEGLRRYFESCRKRSRDVA